MAAIVLLATIAVSNLFGAPNIRITLSNNPKDWAIGTVGPTEIVGGAGGDFPTEYETVVDYKTVDIKNSAGNWRVDVRRDLATWDPNITVYVRRSNTVGGSSITGGTAYQIVTDTDTEFFSGSGDWMNIGLQFKISGAFASSGASEGAHSTTLTYTVTDGLP